MPEIRHSLISYSTSFISFFSILFLFYSHLLIHTFIFNILPFVLRLLVHLLPLLFLLHNICLFPFCLSLLLAYFIFSSLLIFIQFFLFYSYSYLYLTFTPFFYFIFSFFFRFCFPLPLFFLPSCSLFFILCTAVLDVNALFCFLEVSMRSVTAPVVAATRKPCSCQNGGMCHLKRRACHCPPGYFGRRCERVSCKPGCLNGGHCREPDHCVCPPHYSGPRCETRKCSTTT